MAVESQFYSENYYQDWNFYPFSTYENENLYSDPTSSSMASTFSHSFNSELHFQNQEINFLLQFQKEKLRSTLHEQRKKQITAVLSNIETKAWNLMKEKEEELEQATRKAMELEERLKKVEMENEAWKNMANAKEAIVIGLKQQFLALSNAESCCGSCEEEKRKSKKIMGCKRCKNRNPCVVMFLPCRHVCSCKYCEAFLGSCPVCNSVKEASMEVLFV